MRGENRSKKIAATITKEFKILVLFEKMEPINCRAFWEPISCRERRLKLAGNNLRRNLGGSLYFSENWNQLIAGSIGTNKLPERQINGSSYTSGK
jgi:hypothetical protein